MSEAMAVPPLSEVAVKTAPTIYFIDDSATMREVVKIAFRRENMNLIACGDASSAIAQFDQHRPDIVITDVIMPDQDGYAVCSQIKQHPELGATPVLLMSGVVNKSVADKAVAVKADELIRKPFQPQELIARVKSLLQPAGKTPSERPGAPSALTSLFAPSSTMPPAVAEQRVTQSAWPHALAQAFSPKAPGTSQIEQVFSPSLASTAKLVAPNMEAVKLRTEIARVELLVRKLQNELALERQYNQALELQIKTLLEAS